jgi:hypothetical protein
VTMHYISAARQTHLNVFAKVVERNADASSRRLEFYVRIAG